ncbi:MAG: biotin/lipoyl-binding protein [Saprospiraceae bacterium]|nr:biotin/lipoyl-binding protein [Saprospiraceae bacterium]
MKLNIIHILFIIAAAGCYFIVKDIQGQSEYSFFGTAETEPKMLSIDEDAVVKKIYVKAGSYVKKGDTLVVMHSSQFDKNRLDFNSEIDNQSIDITNSKLLLEKEKLAILAETNSKIQELNTKIKTIYTEDSLQTKFRKSVFKDVIADHTSRDTEINAINKEIEALKELANKKIEKINTEIITSEKSNQLKVNQARTKISFQDNESKKLVLVSPIDGYLDKVNIAENSMIQAYRDLFQIYPLSPNRIIGFVPENANIPYNIGDSVQLLKNNMTVSNSKGVIITTSPKLVELPLRLRKFTELRAWGREVMINIPDKNNFYIGEKVTINLINKNSK